MNIFVNGEKREALRATNVAGLVAELGLVPETLLVEHNGTALRRDEWPARDLAAGDRLELIRIVAGG
jgi:thiamine biosynthesis protein ThiS